MCLAQGPQCSDAGEARTCGPLISIKHSTTELPHSGSIMVHFGLRSQPCLYSVTTVYVSSEGSGEICMLAQSHQSLHCSNNYVISTRISRTGSIVLLIWHFKGFVSILA